MGLINKYCTDIRIMPSQTDFVNRLGYYETFRMFMDLANSHAEKLGIDQLTLMNRNLFWLTVKTRIRFYRRPLMSDTVEGQTWPLKPGSLRTDRCYRLCDSQGPLAEGRTEWAIMDLSKGRLANLTEIFPQDLVFNEESFPIEDFPRIVPADGSYEIKGTYRVTSSDIDMGQHMNNAAYVRALIGMFSVQELKDMDIKEITVVFKTSAHEGDVLSMPFRRTGNTMETGLYFQDGKPSLLAQIVC
ncbi:MAG: hypothetical protein LIR25_04900 [bacterium]|jgi:acyl-CoA thioesterase FadM|nr:hypothetical protein [Spirochaetales bacterium]MDT3389910.1 hypothetical protein [bacterium]